MGTTELTTLDNDGIATTVARWLTETKLYHGITLGAWLVEEAWRDWHYTPAQLVGETVGLAIGASSDMYDLDPENLLLFTVTQVDNDGDTYTLNWLDSQFDKYATASPETLEIRLIADHFDDGAAADSNSRSSTLSPITVDATTLTPLFAGDPLACVPMEVVNKRVAALVDQVARVLVHLRDGVRTLPITIATP
jgi:hypothetical protein